MLLIGQLLTRPGGILPTAQDGFQHFSAKFWLGGSFRENLTFLLLQKCGWFLGLF